MKFKFFLTNFKDLSVIEIVHFKDDNFIFSKQTYGHLRNLQKKTLNKTKCNRGFAFIYSNLKDFNKLKAFVVLNNVHKEWLERKIHKILLRFREIQSACLEKGKFNLLYSLYNLEISFYLMLSYFVSGKRTKLFNRFV